MKPLRITYLTLSLAVAAKFSSAEAIKFESGKKTPQLIELYTSEGCSSCPPAEKYVSSLRDEEGLWTDFVPIVFHVDYWDWIGWKDRFASKAYSKRQRQLYKNKQLSSVYTPGFLVAGQEWRGFFSHRVKPKNELESAPKLSLVVENGQYTLSFDGETANTGRAHVALLGMDLETKVERGENAGRNLAHDFVVLNWQQLPAGNLSWSGQIHDTEMFKPQRYAIAAWVEHKDSAVPLQVVGGYLN